MYRDEVGGWTTTRAETRYGCFLPDLTGLARRPSIANLPGHYIGDRNASGNPGMVWKSPLAGVLAGGAAALRIAHQVLPDHRAVAAKLLCGDQVATAVVPDLPLD